MRKWFIVGLVIAILATTGFFVLADSSWTPNQFRSVQYVLNKVYDSTNYALNIAFSGGITMAGDLEMGNTPYSIDGGTNGLAFDPDNDGTNEATMDSDGIIQGDTLNDNGADKLAAEILHIMTDPKLLSMWSGTPGDGTTELDYSGAGETITYTSSSSWTSADQLKQGEAYILDYDGTDDYVTITDSNNLSFGDGANDSDFTIFALVYVAPTPTQYTIISKDDRTTGATEQEYVLRMNSGNKPQMGFWDDSVPVFAYRLVDAALSTGWYFIAAVYDNAGGTGATVMNGVTLYCWNSSTTSASVCTSTATNQGTYVAMENTASDVFIGGYTASGGTLTEPINTDIGLVGIEKSALSATSLWKIWIAVRSYYNV
jgi:hypothetical protein